MRNELTPHIDVVFGYLALRLHPDREQARDLCQEVFRAALAGEARMRKVGSTRAWLLTIARRRLADHFRSNGGRVGELTGFEPARADSNERQSGAERVARTLRELTEKERGLLEEKYIDRRSVREMAQERGSSEKAVESALTRARDAFREAYAKLERAQGVRDA